MKTKITLVMVLLAVLITQTQAQWANVTTNSVKPLYTVSFSGNNAVIGGGNGTIIYSSDAGQTWHDSIYWPWDPVFASGFGSPTSVVMGSYKVYTSTNSGATFSGPYTTSGFGDFRDIVFTTGGNGIAVDNNCKVALSTDAGQNWTSTVTPCSGIPEMDDLDFPTSQIGYLCGANGNVFKTSNGGSAWTPVTAPAASNVSYHCVSFTDANTGFISGKTNNGQDTMVFKKTTDGGASWIDMKYPLIAAGVDFTAVIVSFTFLNQNLAYLVFNNKIYKTADGGASWALDFTNTLSGNASFNKIAAGSNVVMAVGSNGVAARLQGTGTGISEVKQADEIVVYPNPSSGTITLGSFLVNQQNAFLEITDVSGRMVKAEKISTNEVDISGLNNGIYFGKLTNNNGTNYSFKFAKQ